MTNPRFYVIVSSRLWSDNSGLGLRCKGGNSKTSFVEGKGQHDSKTILSQVIHTEISLTGRGGGAASAQPMLSLSPLWKLPPPTAGVYPWSHVYTHEMISPSPAAISLVRGDLVKQILAPRNQAPAGPSSTEGVSRELEETRGVKGTVLGKCVCPSEEDSKGSQASARGGWRWCTGKVITRSHTVQERALRVTSDSSDLPDPFNPSRGSALLFLAFGFYDSFTFPQSSGRFHRLFV